MSQNAQPEDSGSLRSKSEAYQQLHEGFRHKIIDDSGRAASARPRLSHIILGVALLVVVLVAIAFLFLVALRGGPRGFGSHAIVENTPAATDIPTATPPQDELVMADVEATWEVMAAQLKDADAEVEAAQATAEAAQATAESTQAAAESTQAAAESTQAAGEGAMACASEQGYAYEILSGPEFFPEPGTQIESSDEDGGEESPAIEGKVTWRIRNTGQCKWDKIILMAGDEDNRRIIDSARVTLDTPLAPGDEADIVMTFTIQQASQAIDEIYTLHIVYGTVQQDPGSSQMLEVKLEEREWIVPTPTPCSPLRPSDWEDYAYKADDLGLSAVLVRRGTTNFYSAVVQNNCLADPSVIQEGQILYLPPPRN